MNERLREALRRKIAAHNRLVWISSLSSVLGVVVMWCALYFVGRWLAVLGSTVVKGLDATMPQRYDRGFAIFALAQLILGWLADRFQLHQRMRERHGPALTSLELGLLPARATFAALHNLSNHVRFNEDDLCAATDLLVRVVRAGKVAVTAMPLEIPDAPQRERVLAALQLLDLIYLRRQEAGDCYSVADPQRLVRFL